MLIVNGYLVDDYVIAHVYSAIPEMLHSIELGNIRVRVSE